MTKIRDYPNDSLLFEEGAEPATPASGTVRIYAKTGGGMYAKDDAGTETALGGGGGGGIPDAPSDGNTYGRKDGEWEEVAAPTLQEVLDAGNTSDGTATFTALDPMLGNIETSFQAIGMVTNAADVGIRVVYSPFALGWQNSSYFGVALVPPDAASILAAQEYYSINIPTKTGTMLLDSDIGTLVAAADAIPVWVEITQAAYDALDPPDPNTLYVVID